MDIAQKSALVVGGSQGLGEATVRALVAAGAFVVIADVNEEEGTRLAAELGDRALFVKADVADAGQVASAVSVAAEAAGGLRISVCCAGITAQQPIADESGPHSLQTFVDVMNVNLLGTFNVLREASAAMVANEPSVSGERGVCVVGMTLPAARDLASTGIRVCAIAPGTFDTPMTRHVPDALREHLSAAQMWPQRFGRPDEFAALVCHIATNEMLNGETIRLDGAVRVPPIRKST